MAGQDGATVEGVDVCSRAYDAIARDAGNMSEPHRRIAQAGENAARQAAPVRTGRLAASITSSANEKQAELDVNASYWAAQEFGTRWVAARHYLRTGIEAMRREAEPAYHDRMDAVIKAHT